MRKTSGWLIGLTISLLLVGLVSHTPVRHAIQIGPCLISFVLLSRGYKWGPATALPLFSFWLFMMTLIWLFLLGVARVITGQFTPIEIALTISIGLCGLGGLPAAVRALKGRGAMIPALVFPGFFALQAAALWLSMQPQFARM